MTRPLVILDCDDVLADYCGEFRRMVEIYLSPGVLERESKDDPTWGIFDRLHMTDPEKAHILKELEAPGFCASLPVLPGAVEGVSKLKQIAQVIVATGHGHGRHWQAERTRWVHRHFGEDIPVILVDPEWKHLIDGDVMIDDRHETLVKWYEALRPMPILWTTRENEALEEHPCTVRVRSWDRVLDLVGGLR